MKREVGFAVCRIRRTGRLVRGPVSVGTHDRVNVSPTCPPGSTLDNVYHTHPDGLAEPSPQDLREARRAGVRRLCVANNTTTRCYNVY
jgi:hypothetical protein